MKKTEVRTSQSLVSSWILLPSSSEWTEAAGEVKAGLIVSSTFLKMSK